MRLKRSALWEKTLIGLLVIGLIFGAVLMLNGDKKTAPPRDTMGRLGMIIEENESGLYVMAVREHCIAKSAGICAGDLIVQMNGQPVTEAAQLQEQVQNNSSGEIVLCVHRAGNDTPLSIILRFER